MSRCHFDIEGAVDFITKNGFSRVGLQFPSDLLCSSIDVYEELSKRTSSAVAVLGDTPYSSCCVDELAGKRWGVDAVIHFGNACLTESTGEISVFYVFGDIPCPSISGNLAKIGDQITQYLSCHDGPTLFFYDFRYSNTAKKLADHLASESIDLVFSEPALPGLDITTDASFVKHAGRVFRCSDKLKSPRCLLYLGECDSAFYSILVSLKEAYTIKAFTIDPTSGQVAPAPKSALAFLRSRYFLMEKIKSAKRIGILMGTLSASRYRDIVARLKRLLRRAKKPYTTLVVGRINEVKLMNLPDLDGFVLVACPQASLFNDPNLLIPVVTPFELECVLRDLSTEGEASIEHPRRWNGLWMPLDFAADILDSESAIFAPEESVVPARDSEKTVGKEEEEPKEGALVSRDSANWSLALACEDLLLGTRDSWRGLDPALGQAPPLTTIQRGRTGLPTKYSTLCE
ncbi:Diphthamide biosynthesis protein 2 [Echinococcus multilocularis]|uniref:2-(3-amino-3-carboxypropyl)histidine synthase subunit 2 n=1 Tax=Echinococcus multilocularis TaxID=6211 RepID=A0A087W001_ECHMU|nr:Diphthamide biosynthesis protein 2 [Echinococcus multilocularis]